MDYKTLFEQLADFHKHLDQLENNLKEFSHGVTSQVEPHIEKSLHKLSQFRDSIHAIDKALEKARDKEKNAIAQKAQT